jgi:hypothetical protein
MVCGFTMQIDAKDMEDRFASLRNATKAVVFDGGGETPAGLRSAVAKGFGSPP